MDADAERWNARYEGQPRAVSSRPDALTDDLADLVPTRGRAIDVACGAGGQAIWLAERGLHVIALDVSSNAAELTAASAAAAGLDHRITPEVMDLDDGLPHELGDADVIVCQRFRATHLYGTFVDRLAPDGIAVVTVLSETGAAAPGPFHAPSGELAVAFDRPDCDVLAHTEAHGQESIVVRRPSP